MICPNQSNRGPLEEKEKEKINVALCQRPTSSGPLEKNCKPEGEDGENEKIMTEIVATITAIFPFCLQCIVKQFFFSTILTLSKKLAQAIPLAVIPCAGCQLSMMIVDCYYAHSLLQFHSSSQRFLIEWLLL